MGQRLVGRGRDLGEEDVLPHPQESEQARAVTGRDFGDDNHLVSAKERGQQGRERAEVEGGGHYRRPTRRGAYEAAIEQRGDQRRAITLRVVQDQTREIEGRCRRAASGFGTAKTPSTASIDGIRARPRLLRQVRDAVLFVGDAPPLAPVVHALLRVPACVREAALAEASFEGVGATELAHVWLLPRPAMLVTAQGLANVRALTAEDGALRRIEARLERDERLADGPALAWGATAADAQ